jgi:cell division protein FtsB
MNTLKPRRSQWGRSEREQEYWLSYSDLLAGLLMVFALMLLTAMIQHSDDPTEPTERIPTDSLAGLHTTIAEQVKEIDRLTRRTASLTQEVDRLHQGRSSQLPSCREVGLASGFLFDAVIRGADRIEVDGVVGGLNSILRRFNAQLNEARKHQCVHSIQIFYSSGVNLAEYHAAASRLKQHFYTADRGAR